MRIESYTSVQQIYQPKKNGKIEPSNVATSADQVDISNLGKSIQTAKQAVTEAADIREDIVAPIKEQVQSGTYNVSAGNFADKLMAKYEEQQGLFS